MTMPSEKPLGLSHASGENRRASKPLIEKRRRARINQSLAALKAIVVDSRKDNQTQNARPPKLEKADILEMTVTHLRKLHECIEQSPASENEGSSYKAGFFKCIQTIREFIQNESLLTFEQKTRLLSHLCNVTPNSLQSAESIVTQMDDTSSSCSGSSRSNTPSSALTDMALMEYIPCSPPLSDNAQENYLNSSSPPSSTYRTKLHKNQSNVSFPSNYLSCNKQTSRLQSNAVASYASNRVDSEPAQYFSNRPLNLASGPRNTNRNEGPHCQKSSPRIMSDAREVGSNEPSGEYQLFENRIAENESLMQIDPVWRPW